jgi:putative transposase
MKPERISRKHHHLPRGAYIGEVVVAITARTEHGRPIFRNRVIVATFTTILEHCARTNGCLVPVYCFMPEHLHILIKGMSPPANTWNAMIQFKQRTGYWFRKHSRADWQKDFFDRILRRDDSFAKQVEYIINNPVRRGLVENWDDYPYTGSIGFDLKELLADLQTG